MPDYPALPFRPQTGTGRHALVMDPCALSGAGLCDLAAGVLQGADCHPLTCLSALRTAVRDLPAHRTLVITELFSATECLSDGLATLARLAEYRRAGLRLMVCTSVTDPLLLRLAIAAQPSVITLRTGRLPELEAAMCDSAEAWPRTRLSPGAGDLLARSPAVHLSPREAEWWLAQADGLGLQAAADRLRVNYKTAATMRHNVIHRFGDNAVTFARRMAVLRGRTGFGLAG